MKLSPCYGAAIIVAGKGVTHWYACGKCWKPIPDAVRKP